jgi:hypothetical protein
MGFDEMKEKLTEGLEKLGGKEDDAIDKAEGFVDEKTGDKYDAQTDKGADMAKEGLDKLPSADDQPPR